MKSLWVNNQWIITDTIYEQQQQISRFNNSIYRVSTQIHSHTGLTKETSQKNEKQQQTKKNRTETIRCYVFACRTFCVK